MPAALACPYSDAQLVFFRSHPAVAEKVEKAARSLVLQRGSASSSSTAAGVSTASRSSGGSGSGTTAPATSGSSGPSGIDLTSMPRAQRIFAHSLASLFGLSSVATGAEPHRYIRLALPPLGAAAPIPASATAGAGSPSPFSAPDAMSSIGSLLPPPYSSSVILPSLTLAQAAQLHARRLDAAAGTSGGVASGGGASGGSSSVGTSVGGAVRLRLAPSTPLGSSGGGSGAGGSSSSVVVSFAAAAAAARASNKPPLAAGGTATVSSTSASSGSAWPRGGGGGGGSSSAVSARAPAPPGLQEPLARTMDPAARGAVILVHGLRRGTREADVADAFDGGTGRASGGWQALPRRGVAGSSSGGGDASASAAFRFRRVDDAHALLTFDNPGRAARAMAALQANIARGAVSAPFRARYWGVGVEELLSAPQHQLSQQTGAAASVPVVTAADAAAAGSWRAASARAAVSGPNSRPAAPPPAPLPSLRPWQLPAGAASAQSRALRAALGDWEEDGDEGEEEEEDKGGAAVTAATAAGTRSDVVPDSWDEVLPHSGEGGDAPPLHPSSHSTTGRPATSDFLNEEQAAAAATLDSLGLGFTAAQCAQAALQYGSNIDAGVNWLLDAGRQAAH
jgi:hypothetical protein